MSISCKDDSLATHAFEQAMQSPCLMRHGCVATINGKIVGRGYNSYRCNSGDGFIQNTCSCHAEIHTIRNMYYRTKASIKRRDKMLKVV